MTVDDQILLEVHRLSKRFPGVQALSEVDLTLHRGEVLAVIGENGAGKSTLVKILAGVQRPDEGSIALDRRAVHVDSCRAAMNLGIVLIHQELNLSDNLSVAANIFLGREPRRMGLIDTKRINAEARRYQEMVGLDVSPDTIVNTLSIGRRQMVEIAKALSIDARILIMDEPTSSLSSRETEALFRLMEDLQSKGVSIIYISHRLAEVHQLADRVTVLRDGKNVCDLVGSQITHDKMVECMVGRNVAQFYTRKRHDVGDVLLEAKNLVTPSWPQHALSFQVRCGEIVSLAGLVGAGRSELLRVLFGVDKALSGELRLADQPRTLGCPADAIDCQMALIPEDRKLHGLILEMSIRANISLAGVYRDQRLAGFLNRKKEYEDAVHMMERLSIRTPSVDQSVRLLSGGNQQKVVIGKWLALQPRILLMDEPTRGIDVGAREEVYRLMEQLARDGMGILFASSEMEEVLGMSDRTLVMHEGRIMGQLWGDELSEEAVMRLATGNAPAA